MTKTIAVLDTSIASDNLGDQIIMEAVDQTIREVAPNALTVRVPTHVYMDGEARSRIAKSDLRILGGTNLLQPQMFAAGALWKLRPSDIVRLKPVVLLSVGWRGYLGAPSWASRLLLTRVLDRTLIQSARDGYTRDKLAEIVPKALNTSCVTMWGLSAELCGRLPTTRASDVVTTLTHYSQDPEADRATLELLRSTYRKVFFWPQQSGDLSYLAQLGVPGVTPVSPTLRAYDDLLGGEDLDFVGTRLHGGIRALQRGHRALIIGFDNRSIEIARDTGLPLRRRGDLEGIGAWIGARTPTTLCLPQPAIADWKAQFAQLA